MRAYRQFREGLPITYHLSPITYHLLPITYHLIPITSSTTPFPTLHASLVQNEILILSNSAH